MLITISCTNPAPVQSEKADLAEVPDCENCVDVPFSYIINGEIYRMKLDTLTGRVLIKGKKYDDNSENLSGITISFNNIGGATLKMDSLKAKGLNDGSSVAMYGVIINATVSEKKPVTLKSFLHQLRNKLYLRIQYF